MQSGLENYEKTAVKVRYTIHQKLTHRINKRDTYSEQIRIIEMRETEKKAKTQYVEELK